MDEGEIRRLVFRDWHDHAAKVMLEGIERRTGHRFDVYYPTLGPRKAVCRNSVLCPAVLTLAHRPAQFGPPGWLECYWQGVVGRCDHARQD